MASIPPNSHTPAVEAVSTLVLVLGDQLDPRWPVLDGLDQATTVIAMGEVRGEATRFPNHVQRVAMFLAAMRHAASDLRAAGWHVVYQSIADDSGAPTLSAFFARCLAAWQPSRARMLEAGEWEIEQALRQTAVAAGVPLEVYPDPHFYQTRTQFAAWTQGRKVLRLEHFYRHMRRETGVLLTADGQPEGGDWNYDVDNRKAFGAAGPMRVQHPLRFAPNAVTAQVLADLRDVPGLWGQGETFDWPVTRPQALEVLDRFLDQALPWFGAYQDAIWLGEPWLYHSTLSAALNLKLLDPREVVAGALDAYRQGLAPLAAVEGFVRQILGWREFIRGVYWTQMPGYLERNALGANLPIPPVYWTGQTRMACLGDVVTQLQRTGYAHHIQRLMVAGLFAQLYGVRPHEVHDWFMAAYVDSVEWVTAPNVIGMSQFADGGIVASKPYIASGQYIARQSNACVRCAYDPKVAVGPTACPFTTLYWDFVARHETLLANNPRLAPQVRNWARKSPAQQVEIRAQANVVRQGIADGTV